MILRRIWGFVRFLLHFFWLFLKANLEVARLVLFVPRSRYNPGFLDYSIEEMTFKEALLLSHCITLTPGTITVLLDREQSLLRIHVLNFIDPAAVRGDIDKNLKEGIWRFTR